MILPAFLLAVILLPASSPEAPCATAADSARALGEGTPEGGGITGIRMNARRRIIGYCRGPAASEVLSGGK